MSLDKTKAIFQKRFKKRIMGTFSEMKYPYTETVSTGSLKLDWTIGRKKKLMGVPRGRITVLWGHPKTGKSTLAYHIIANVQKNGGIAALIDTEFSFDPEYAASQGVNVDDLQYIFCFDEDTGEAFPLEVVWEIVEILVRSKAIQVIVIDSLDDLILKAELEGEFGESHMGKRAFLNSQAARKLVGPVRISHTALVFIAQVRYKLGVLFGSPETMSGGSSIKHWCGLKIDMRRGKQIKEGDEIVGHEVKVFIPWSKIEAPFGKTELEFYFDGGFIKEPDILEYGEELGLFEKKSSYYYLADKDNFVQGKAKAIQYLKDHPELAESLETQIREKLSGLRKETEVESPAEQSEESQPATGGDT